MPIDPRHAQAQLSLSVSRNLQQILQDHSQRNVQISRQLVQDGVATGFVDVASSGESTVDVAFPIVFTERPVFNFGFELGPSAWIEQGQFPLGTAIVTRWKTKALNEMPTWVGASLAIVLTGIQGPYHLHYHFTGRTLATPTGTT